MEIAVEMAFPSASLQPWLCSEGNNSILVTSERLHNLCCSSLGLIDSACVIQI